MFQTHNNLEHLAMMEAVMGKIPAVMSKKARAIKGEFFKGTQIDYPNSQTTRNSKNYVKKMKKLAVSRLSSMLGMLQFAQGNSRLHPHTGYHSTQGRSSPPILRSDQTVIGLESCQTDSCQSSCSPSLFQNASATATTRSCSHMSTRNPLHPFIWLFHFCYNESPRVTPLGNVTVYYYMPRRNRLLNKVIECFIACLAPKTSPWAGPTGDGKS